MSNYQKGRNILRFILTNNQGEKLSAYALLQLRGGEVCEGGICNLVSNGGFENLDGTQQCGVIDELAQPVAGWPWVFIDCWSTFSGNPDIHSENCGDQRFDYQDGGAPWDTGGTVPSDPSTENDNALVLYSRIYQVQWNGGTPPFEEAIQGLLANSLIPGQSYEISLRYFRRDGGNPHLRIYFRDGESNTDISQIIDEANMGLIADPDWMTLPINPNDWQTLTATFVVPANQPNLDHIVIANESTFLNMDDPENMLGKLFIDDVQVRPIQNATFNIPGEFICNGTIGSLQNLGAPAGGVVTGPGVTTPNFTFNSSLVVPGTYTLNYSVTDAIGCVLTATDQVTVHPTIQFNNTIVNPTCGQSCSGSIILNPSLSAPATVNYSWTGPSINAGNQNSLSLTNLCAGTYTITALINGVCPYTQTFNVIANSPPIVSATVDYDFCATSCNGTISVVSSVPNSTISWSGGLLGFNPSGVCAGTYSATVVGPNLCAATPIQVTIVSQPLQTINVNTSQTWGTSNEYDNINVSNNALLTISGTTTVITVNGTITITDGARLIISQATVRFGPSGRIVIQAGGRAYVQQAVLTANCPNTYWRGVEVRGNTNYSQNDISLSNNLNNPSINNDGLLNQGGIWIDKNARIEYADIAVKLYQGTIDPVNPANSVTSNSGGFIRAEESTFRNNRRDVAFSTYGAASYQNLSSFRRCTFEVNTNHFTSGDILRERVLIRQTAKVLFEGCTWINSSMAIANPSSSNSVQHQAALRLMTGNCLINQFVSGSTAIPCRFLGFIYGVRADGTYLSHPLIVNNAIFRCYRSVRSGSSASGSSFNKCNFGALNTSPSPVSIAVPDVFINNPSTTPWVNNASGNNGNPTLWASGPAYGIYLNSPGSTIVRDNTFNIIGIISNQRVGLYLNVGAANNVDINGNEFRGNSFGIRFFNSNRDSGSPAINGTIFQCNEFASNDLHVEINAHNVNATNAGINQDIWSATLNRSYSNEFDAFQSPITSLPSGRNIWDNVMPFHLYRGRLDEVSSITTRVGGIGGSASIGVEYSNIGINPVCGATNFSMSVNDLLADFELKKTALENYRDNGNPEYYQYLIESINSANIVQRFNELSSASPSLTVDRIIEVLDRESELPRSMLLNILMSNISSLKNGESLSKLDSLQTPLTAWEKDSLFTLFSNIDAKGILEAQVNAASFAVYRAINEELNAVMLDSLVTNKTSAIEDFYNKLGLISDSHSELIQGQDAFNYTLMLTLINNRLSYIRETSMEGKDLNSLKELIEEAMSYDANDSTFQLNYDGFASNYIIPELPLTYRMANLIVNRFDSTSYHGDLEYPFGLPGTRSLFKPNQKEVHYEIKSFPNPACSYFQLQSEGEDIGDCMVMVRDMTGREIPLDVLTKSRNEVVFNVNEWANGSYIIELRREGELIYTNNIIIQR